MVKYWIMQLPWVYSGLIVITCFVGLMLLILWITRQFVSSQILKSCHDVGGFTFGIIGLIYGVLLGFTVVEVNNRFNGAKTNIIEEAAILMELFRDADVFSKEHRVQIQHNLRNYARLVYEDEWPKLSQGQESEAAKKAIHVIWKGYQRMTPSGEKEKIWYQISLQKLNDLSQHRVVRVFHGRQSIGNLMWTLLILGAVITVLFMCFFSPDSMLVQMAMMSLLAGTIAFMLFFILSLDGIYTGDVKLQPVELKKVIEKFDETLQKQ